MERCLREIAAIEAALMAGDPDVQGLCHALSDWSAELRILRAEAKKTAGSDAAGLGEGESLGFDRVTAHRVLALGRCQGEPHLLADSPCQESSQRVHLPSGDLQQFFRSCATRTFQQLKHLVGLAVGFGRFLGYAPLLSALGGRTGGATSRIRAALCPLRALWLCFCVCCVHVGLLGAGWPRDVMNRSVLGALQVAQEISGNLR